MINRSTPAFGFSQFFASVTVFDVSTLLPLGHMLDYLYLKRIYYYFLSNKLVYNVNSSAKKLLKIMLSHWRLSKGEEAMADKISLRDSNCAGFYHWQPIWIGTTSNDIDSALSTDPNTEVFADTMQCGVRTKVSLKGVFVFDFSNWPCGAVISIDDWENPVSARMRFMNLFLACFYSVIFQQKRIIIEKMFIDFDTYAFSKELDLNPFHFGCASRQAAVIQANEEQHKQYRQFHPLVTPEVVSEAINLTDKAIVDESNDAALLGELMLHAFKLHDSGKYEASHISAWTITERCMNQIWQSHLDNAERQHTKCTGDSDEKFINSTRREKLTGRDFTASIISEILSLNGLLPFKQYKLVCKVRQTRNAWLHKLRAINREDSSYAIFLAQFMLRHSKVLDLHIPSRVFESIPISFVSQ